MDFVIKDGYGNYLYKIYPYNDLCWTIDRWSKITPKDESKESYWDWKRVEKYPTTLEQAFISVEKLMQLNKNECVEEFEELKALLNKNTELILQAIKERRE